MRNLTKQARVRSLLKEFYFKNSLHLKLDECTFKVL